ncbi:hypothetical protein B0H17DRAFT_1136362 [Mycena rosella]|uniref:Uncharacterized protein n=1 Tax=Mycena rosella TaxID=1033263 RepID=A0AAD7GBY3_MYCRO|nr:hypothetical protein B0H17DRAFT_1136362 [Mycena rosella]
MPHHSLDALVRYLLVWHTSALIAAPPVFKNELKQQDTAKWMPLLSMRQLRDWVQTPGRTDSERVARPIRLFAPFHDGLGAGLSLFFGVSWLSTQLAEWRYDGDSHSWSLCRTCSVSRW